jgi:hypothetical protein
MAVQYRMTRWLITFGCCVLSFFAGAAWLRRGQSHVSTLPEGGQAFLSRGATSHWHQVQRAGPTTWGVVERQKLPLYRPDDAFESTTSGDTNTHWFFRSTNATEVIQILHEAGIASGGFVELFDTNRWTSVPSGEGYVLHPSDDVGLRLSAPQRASLYHRLGGSPQNRYHRTPIRLGRESFDDLVASAGWPSARAERLRSLAYPDRGTVTFCDTPLLLAGATPEETLLCLKELWRIPTVQLRLRLNPKSDLDALIRYWGPGSHERVVRPLLRSVAALPGGGTLSVSDLLPQFARQRLLRFGRGTPAHAAHEDCYWTAMNFFNATPEAQFTEWQNTERVLRSRYRRVLTNEWSFGDVLLITDGDTTMHMCVYIADDVVFTKNGPLVWQPWVFMTWEDVLALYPPERRRVAAAFRRND